VDPSLQRVGDMRIVTTRLGALATAALTLSLAACDARSSKMSADMGAVKMALDIAPGTTLSTISYRIDGPGMFTKMGSIDVSHSSTIAADISPLPPGMNFTIALSAMSDDGATMCMGSQNFDITARTTTPVLVHLLCKQPTTNGSVAVNGVLNVCPLIDSIGSSPGEVFVGGAISLSGLGHDTDSGPAPLTYQWTAMPASGGAFNSASAQNPIFTCLVPGTVTITLTISDGDSVCADTQTIPVTCTAASSGTGGTTGSAGSTGTGGTGGTTGTGGAGGSTGGGGGGGGSSGSGGATGGSGGSSGGGGATGGSGGSSGGGGASGGSGGTTGGGGGGGTGVSCGPGSSNAAVVVYRVGDGSGALVATGNVVVLDAFTSTGALVCSTAMPTTTSGSVHSLIASGAATSEGLLSRSTDGHTIVLAGYNGMLGGPSLAGTTSATTPRVVGRVDAAGNVDTTTALTDWASANNPRSVASTDGASFWLGGAAGSVRYATLGASTSTQLSTSVTNVRQVGIFAGQLYTSSSSGSFRLATVGTGVPTTAGQTITNLPMFPTTGSPYGYFFADLDAGVAGVDTVYVADDSTGAPGGVTKYSLVGGNWVSNGIGTGATDPYRGLTGSQSGSTVTLYGTRTSGTASQLVSIVDTSGYNAAISGTPTLLATAGTNTAFRGVALAPQ
jgi:hypothetical protein